MSGVWVFNNGVSRLKENPSQSSQKKVLVHLPTDEVVSSHSLLKEILMSLGWEIYNGGESDVIQYHKRSSIDLISLPKDFSKLHSVYMYDIVVKNPNSFQVRNTDSNDL